MELSTILIVMTIGLLIVVYWMSRVRARELLSNPRFVELTNVQELDDLFSSSRRHAQLLFLYDPWCPISAAATRQMTQLERKVMTINVSHRHDLSRQIEKRTGIRHESPQAIVIDQGVAVWDASHSAITSQTLASVMREIEDENDRSSSA